MTLLLLLPLLITTPVAANTPAYCADIYAVLMEFVEEGSVSINEANEMYARCARAPDL
jgi:hypothetical protein